VEGKLKGKRKIFGAFEKKRRGIPEGNEFEIGEGLVGKGREGVKKETKREIQKRLKE